jgi:hypothetical protein
MKRLPLIIAVLTILLGGIARVRAGHIDTGGPTASAYVTPFGESNTATYGQTFTVTATDTILDNFTFWMDDYQNPGRVDFAGYVMAWDGMKATGPMLYQSSKRTTTNNSGAGGMEQFTFTTGGIQLNAGQEYVAFLSASNFFDGVIGTAWWSVEGDRYAGGNFVFHNNGNDFALLTSTGWHSALMGPVTSDTAFRASFSTPTTFAAPTVVPEPASVILLGLGVIGLLTYTWMKQRRRVVA